MNSQTTGTILFLGNQTPIGASYGDLDMSMIFVVTVLDHADFGTVKSQRAFARSYSANAWGVAEVKWLENAAEVNGETNINFDYTTVAVDFTL